MNIKVYDILHPSNKEWLDVFENYRTQILTTYEDKYIENYDRKRFCLEDQLGVFLTVDVETREVVRFESVFCLDSWPKTIVRMFNRTWVDPSFRMRGLSSLRNRLAVEGKPVNSMYSYQMQIDCARGAGATCAIFSREIGKNSGSKIETVTHLMNRFFPGWEIAKGEFYLTCNNEQLYSCWQRIASLELVSGGRRALEEMQSINDSQFLQRFGWVYS